MSGRKSVNSELLIILRRVPEILLIAEETRPVISSSKYETECACTVLNKSRVMFAFKTACDIFIVIRTKYWLTAWSDLAITKTINQKVRLFNKASWELSLKQPISLEETYGVIDKATEERVKVMTKLIYKSLCFLIVERMIVFKFIMIIRFC